MSSSPSLPSVQTQLTRYGMVSVLVLGCFGNALVARLFSRHRHNPCSMYLLCAAVMNNIFLLSNIPLQVFITYHGDPTVSSLIWCKLRYYCPHVWGQMARYFLILACIDRFALTNSNIHIRSLSRPSTARLLMILTTVFSHAIAIHLLVMITVTNERCGPVGLYYTVYTFYLLIFFNLVPPVSMTIFGSMAYFNMKRLHSRIRPAANIIIGNRATRGLRRQDRELLRMLLVEVIIYVAATLLYPFILMEVSVTSLMAIRKSLQQLEIESFLLFVASYLVTLNHAAPFFIYVLVSKSFRRDVKQLFKENWHRITRRLEVTFSHATARTVVQVESQL